jgi:PIN domain nuclease of toxin-antitoxin system
MLLLDTHALVWLASDQTRLPEKALQGLRNSAGNLYVSAVSAWELATLVRLNRLHLPRTAAEFYEEALDCHGITELVIDGHIALHAVGLPPIHNDPFDRILIATAELNNLRIVTKDTIIPTYPGVRTVWS